MELIDALKQQKLWLQKGLYNCPRRDVPSYMPEPHEHEALKIHERRFDENCRKVAAALDVFIDEQGFALSGQVYDDLCSFNREVEEQARTSGKELCILYATLKGDGLKRMATPVYLKIGNPYLSGHSSIKFSQFEHFLAEAVRREFNLPSPLDLGQNRLHGLPKVLKVDAQGGSNFRSQPWEVVMYKDEEAMIKAIRERVLPTNCSDYEI